MMNGTPEKHSFSSSEEKRGKQRKEGGHRVRWKVKTGWGSGGQTCMMNILSYFAQVQ